MAVNAAPQHLDTFVAGCGDALLRYARRELRGFPGVEPEEALQEGLVKLWRQHGDELPADPNEARAHVFQAIKFGAREAVRRYRGEGESTRSAVPTDYQAAELTLEGPALGADGSDGAGQLDLDTARAIARASVGSDHADAVGDAAIVVEAVRALEPLELQVLIRDGAPREQIAAELGITLGQVKNYLHSGREMLLSLIEHANGGDLREKERERLVALLNGEITDRKENKAARKHLRKCATCRAVAAQEQRVRTAGARVFLPLPALLGIAKPLAAATGAAGAAASGGGAAADSSGGGLSGLATTAGTKVAAAVATLALVAGGAATYTLAHTAGKTHHPRSAPGRHAAAPANVLALAPRPVAHPAAGARPARAHRPPRHKHRRRHKRRARTLTPPPPPPVSAQPTPVPASQPAPAPAAAPQPSSSPSRPTAASGGEFVLGSK